MTEALMHALLTLCLAASCALSATGLAAQTRGGHDAFHSWYQGLKSPEGDSCCNEKDCHPVDSRHVEGAPGEWILEIRIGGRWVPVPPQRILPQSSPDGGVHACYSDPAPFMTETTPGLVIRCVVTGGVS
jgi:hypothetical protein